MAANQNPRSPLGLREGLANILVWYAQLAFAALLFVSPLALESTLQERAFGPVFAVYTDLQFRPADGLLVLTLALWLLALLVRLRPPRFAPWFITLPLAGLVALSWAGAAGAVDPTLAYYHSLHFTLLLGLVLFLVNENVKPVWAAVPLALGLVSQGAIAIGQFAAQHSLGLQVVGESNLDPTVSGISIVRLDDMRVLRAYGLTDHPNLLGGFLAVGILLVLGYYLSLSGRSRWRLALLLPLAVGSVALLLTFSRAAALGLLAGAGLIALYLLARPRAHLRELRDMAVAGAVGLAVVGLPVLANGPLLAQRLGQDDSFTQNIGEQRSLTEREVLIASTERLLGQYWLQGVGNGNLPVAMYLLDDKFPTEYYYQPAHLVPLAAAAELGIAGGALWLWLLVAPWAALLLARKRVKLNVWLAATLALLLALTVIGLFDYYPWLLAPGRIWQWSAFGLYGAAFLSARTSK